LRVVEFEPSHLKDINLRAFDQQVILGVPDAIERITAQSRSGVAYTGFDDNGGIVAMGGVCILWQGVGSGWVLTSDLMVKYKIWTHRTIRDILKAAINRHNLHRVESLILEHHGVSMKWAERLGFQCEGLLRKYDTAGNNYWIFSRVI
jgi:RimJ/RimL family protein N-acetyltransferase